MASTHVDIEKAEWTPGTPFYGPAASYDGSDIVQLKVLSDRRQEGGGIAWLAKFLPPPGKLIKESATGDTYKVYEGKVTIKAQVRRPKDETGPLQYTLTIQACDDKRCLARATVKKTIP